MTWGPDDELKHPRDPNTGQWVDAVNARLMMGGSIPSGFPLEGMAVPAAGLIAARESVGSFGQMEFWDPDRQTWIIGVDASVILDPEDFSKKRIWFRNPTGAPTVTLFPGEHDRVTIRPRDPNDLQYAELGSTPDPAMEYLDSYSGRWIPGSEIGVDDDPNAARRHWMWNGMEIQASMITGFSKQELLARPRHIPTRLDYMMGDPDNPGAHLLPAEDLLLSPSYTNGGYEILGPDGRWHTIEEVYRDDPDEEEMELIADGLHLPHLDTSEEISVRRTPPGRL